MKVNAHEMIEDKNTKTGFNDCEVNDECLISYFIFKKFYRKL